MNAIEINQSMARQIAIEALNGKRQFEPVGMGDDDVFGLHEEVAEIMGGASASLVSRMPDGVAVYECDGRAAVVWDANGPCITIL